MNWPPLRVSKLTFRALVLRQSEWRNCGNIPSVATVTYKLMATKLRQSFRRFHRNFSVSNFSIFQSMQRSQTRTKRSLHEQLYRRYLSSREELTQFITTVKFFHLVLKDTWEISDTSLASLGIKNFNLKQHSMYYSVYYKPTDSCYLSYSSSHPSHVKTSIPFFIVIQALSFRWLSCFCRSSGPPPSPKNWWAVSTTNDTGGKCRSHSIHSPSQPRS